MKYLFISSIVLTLLFAACSKPPNYDEFLKKNLEDQKVFVQKTLRSNDLQNNYPYLTLYIANAMRSQKDYIIKNFSTDDLNNFYKEVILTFYYAYNYDLWKGAPINYQEGAAKFLTSTPTFAFGGNDKKFREYLNKYIHDSANGFYIFTYYHKEKPEAAANGLLLENGSMAASAFVLYDKYTLSDFKTFTIENQADAMAVIFRTRALFNNKLDDEQTPKLARLIKRKWEDEGERLLNTKEFDFPAETRVTVLFDTFIRYLAGKARR